jgi:hypothetical protein
MQLLFARTAYLMQGTQLPLEQESAELHAWPQLPQLLLLLVVSMQPLLQQVHPERQVLPHVPQFPSSVLVSTQVPLQQLFPVAQ